MKTLLLNAQTSNTSGAEGGCEYRNYAESSRGPILVGAWLEASGVFDGATVTLETSSDQGASWINHAETALTAAGAHAIHLPSWGLKVRGKLVSAGANTSVTLRLL